MLPWELRRVEDEASWLLSARVDRKHDSVCFHLPRNDVGFEEEEFEVKLDETREVEELPRGTSPMTDWHRRGNFH